MSHSKRILLFVATLLSIATVRVSCREDSDHHIPYGFTQNVGQVIDQSGKTNTAVQFLQHGRGVSVQIRKSGFSYDVYVDAQGDTFPRLRVADEDVSRRRFTVHRIDVDFVGASEHTDVVGVHPLPGVRRVRVGDRYEGTHAYDGVEMRGVYPGIDVRFALRSDGQVEYDIVAQPQADLSLIRMRYQGAKHIAERDGAIAITTPFGELLEQIPSSFTATTHTPVDVLPVVNGDTVSFAVPTHSQDESLVIDPVPVISWATYYGGKEVDVPIDLIVHPNGGTVVLGYTFSADNIATAGAHQAVYSDTADLFIARFRDDGSLQWATYYGGESDEIPGSLATDALGNVYACGITYSKQGIASPGAFQDTSKGLRDGMLVKFDQDGQRIWATYFGGSADDGLYDVLVMTNGQIACAGYGASDGLATGGMYQTQRNGDADGIVVVFRPDLGTRIMCTYLGGANQDILTQIEQILDGSMIVAGYTRSDSGLATNGTHQFEYGGGQYDVFVTRLYNTSQRAWTTYVGGTGDDYLEGSGLTYASDGRLYLCIQTSSPNAIATAGVFQPTYGGGSSDAALIQMNTSGVVLWGTYIGGTGAERGRSVMMNSSSSIIVAGSTTSETGIATPGGINDALQGLWDGYLLMFDQQGSRTWGTYVGGANLDYLYECREVSAGSYVSIGETWSSSNIAVGTVHQRTLAGNSDAFVMAFSECDPPVPLIIGPDTVCGSATAQYRVASPDTNNTYEWSVPLRGSLITPADSSTVTIQWLEVGADTLMLKETSVDGCSGVTFFAVTIQDTVTPVIEVVKGALQACVGDSVVLQTTEQYDTYRWSTGDTTRSVTISSSGSIWVVVTRFGCSATAAPVVTEFVPTPTTLITGPTAACLQGDPTTAYMVDTDPTATIAWSGIDLGSPQDPLDSRLMRITWNSAGVDTVLVTSTNTIGCLSRTELIVEVADSLKPTIEIVAGNDRFCVGDTLVLSAGSGYTTYLWNTGATTPTIRVTQSGSFTVVVGDGLCTGTSAPLDVASVPKPDPQIDGPAQVCQSAVAVTFTASGNTQDAFAWTTSGLGTITSTATAQSVEVQWTKQGRDTISVTVTTPEGCKGTAYHEVVVSAGLMVSIEGNPNREICAGDSIVLSSTTVADELTWLRDGIQIATGTSVIVQQSGNYRVVATTTVCVDTSDVVVVSVVPAPSVTVMAVGDQLVATADAVDGYQWFDGQGVPIAGATSSRYAPLQDGVYTVEVRRGPCVVASEPILFERYRETDLFVVSDVDFGTVPVDTFINANGGHVNEFIVVNVSSQNLSLDSATVNAPEFSIPNQFPRLMRPGDTSRITIRFRPTQITQYATQIRVFFNTEVGSAQARGAGRQLADDERITEVILQPDRLEVSPGETFEVLLSIGSERPSASKAVEFEATMQWDARVLEIVSSPEVLFRTTGREDNYFTAKVPEGHRTLGQSELIRIPFRAKLSDVDSTVLVFSGASAFRWKDDTKAYPACRDSIVRIRICHDGGERLLAKRGSVQIQGVAPHPAGDVATVVFSVTRPMTVLIQIIDPLGSVVQERIHTMSTEGSGSATFDLGGLPPGPYIIRFIDSWNGASHVFIRQ